MPSVILVNVWKGVPFFTVCFLAGLKAIPADLYEAATIDGASSWQRFVHVTLPGLRHVITVTVTLSSIWTFNNFDLIWLLTQGGPGDVTAPYVLVAYSKAILQLQYGAGAAVTLVMLPVIGGLVFVLVRLLRQDSGVKLPGGPGPRGGSGRHGGPDGAEGAAVGRRRGGHRSAGLGVATDLLEGGGGPRGDPADRGGGRPGGLGAPGTRAVAGRRPWCRAWGPVSRWPGCSSSCWARCTGSPSRPSSPRARSSCATNDLWPTPWTLEQFGALFTNQPFGRWYLNTLLVSAASTAVALVCAALAGYALARLRFRGAQGFTVTVLLTYVMPGALLFIPLYQLLIGVRLTDSLWSLVVTYPTFTLPFATWLLTGYFASIPIELEEAALVDGCTRLQAFRRVVLPLAKPGLLAVALFTLTNAWNEFLFAFVFITKDEYKTLPVGMQSMIAGDVVPQGQLAAASLLVSIPVVIMYAFGQRFLTEGLTAGAVKG